MSEENKNWVAFHFESNQAWGLCETPEEWLRIKNAYCEYHKTINLSRAKINEYRIDTSPNSPPDFGFRIEHQGEYTLADFAKDNNMTL